MKISLAEVDKMMEYLAIAPLLRAPANYAYFVSHATRDGALRERNDGSFISRAPRNIDPQYGTRVFQRREYRDTCNMCNEPGHLVRDCELYRNLKSLGWVSHSFSRETGRGGYYYGPFHKRLGEIAGPPPPTF